LIDLSAWRLESCVITLNKRSKSLEPKIIPFLNRKIRRRIKVISPLPTKESALKIIHLRVAELNEKMVSQNPQRIL